MSTPALRASATVEQFNEMPPGCCMYLKDDEMELVLRGLGYSEDRITWATFDRANHRVYLMKTDTGRRIGRMDKDL